MAAITLTRTGQKMPITGFGLWKVPKNVCADTVYNALKAGYRLLDCACDYGNETQAGEGLARAIKDGIVKREDVFITSKLWQTFHAKEHVLPITKKQLADWGIDYFDLFLIHFPISLKYVDPSNRYPPEWFSDDGKTVDIDTVPMEETWKAMEELVDAGLAKNIGLSNTSGSLLLDVVRYARIQPSVLQIELHPYLTQENMVALCKKLNIAITGYSSFGPQSWVELNMTKGSKSLLENDTIGAIAQAHNKTPAQVLLRWNTMQGIAVVPKSANPERLVQNFVSEDFDLTPEEMKAISALNLNIRFNDPGEIDLRMSIFA